MIKHLNKVIPSVYNYSQPIIYSIPKIRNLQSKNNNINLKNIINNNIQNNKNNINYNINYNIIYNNIINKTHNCTLNINNIINNNNNKNYNIRNFLDTNINQNELNKRYYSNNNGIRNINGLPKKSRSIKKIDTVVIDEIPLSTEIKEKKERTTNRRGHSIGFKMFLKNLYITSSIGFGSSIVAGLLISQVIPPYEILTPTIGFIGVLASIACYISVPTEFETVNVIIKGDNLLNHQKEKSTSALQKDKQDGPEVIKLIGPTSNALVVTTPLSNILSTQTLQSFKTVQVTMPIYTPLKYVSFFGTIASFGLIISPFIPYLPMESVIITAVMSFLVTGGAAIYSTLLKTDKIIPYKPVVYSSLTVLIGMNLLSLLSVYLFGPNSFSTIAHSIDTYASIALFTSLSSIDTRIAIKKYSEKKPDFILHSIDLILDAVNIFIRILHQSRRHQHLKTKINNK